MSALTTVKVNDVGGVLHEWQRETQILVTDKNVMITFELRTGSGTKHLHLRQARDTTDSQFWDTFGDDYGTPERAMAALMKAPSPFSHYIAQRMLSAR